LNTLKNLQTGDSLPEISLEPVSRLDLIKYAGASGDYNPIHTIDEEAKKAGLPGIIAHGMWTMGNLSKLFTPFYENGFIENFSVRFRDMVFLNDTITFKAVLRENKDNRMKFNVTAENQKGSTVLKGEVIFRQYE
jgi:acyl dehydratase